MTANLSTPEPVETTSAGSGLSPAGPYAAAAGQYWDAGWRGVLPLPVGKKFPPPSKFTGYDALTPSRPDIQAWLEDRPDGNVALHLPDGVIGIDVDAYGDKTGAHTIAEAQKRWGTLPATWFSSARADGSGISLYTVPAGTRLATKISFPDLGLGHIEIIQTTHRYLVVAPSVHPSGDEYRWRSIDGHAADSVPSPNDLPALPDTWLEALKRTPEPGPTRPDAEPVVVTGGLMSDRVCRALSKALEGLSDVDSRHDAMTANTMALARLVEQGEPGVGDASDVFRGRFVAAVTADGSRTEADANAEYERAWTSALSKVARTPTVEVADAQIIQLADSRRAQEMTVDFPEGGGDVRLHTVADTTTEERGLAGIMLDGATFIHGEPDGVTSLWGDGDRSLWADGESLIICGPQGVGKTTLAGNVLAALISATPATALGLPVRRADRVLYLAMDRPRQAARALRRQLGSANPVDLESRLVVWKGPPPYDLAKNTRMLTELAEAAEADTVIVDSLKDAAIGLSDDEVGAGWNRARQALLASGRNILELHHIKKISADKKPDIADVYGSTWITSGAGSVILLNGNPGDAVVRFHHVKQPVEELGPWMLLHDQQSGQMAIHGQVDLIAAAASGGLTVKDAARLLFETDKPDRNKVEKARRKLDGLVRDGRLTSRVATSPKDPVTYHPITVRQEAS
ncbi:bifunctional DNA primase/polymerase [Gordonia sp. SL306]|uniref:bifunctional DNA primase/polymerase n=1 Tax=Gordonia sp. SL306 TaxID=2995145 RepID=UPI002270E208|nr:bifunctional DNA primase/polymerase [Gordonia sp. SL306]WAC54271.1 bifunctional DNA primase/polymerase [Gordonia sp. SL306]